MTYPLGWSVVPQLLVQRERWPGGYKVKSMPMVQPGQLVQPDQPIMRLERLDMADSLGSLPRLSLPATPSGGLSAAHNYALGKYEIIPSGLRGKVIAITTRGGVVVESAVAVVQGTVGAGKQVAGVLTLWEHSSSDRAQPYIPPGAILVVPGPVSFALLRQALSSGVAGVVASSVSSKDFEGFLRSDLIQMLDSFDTQAAQTSLPPLTILLTEGLGTLPMPVSTLNLLSAYEGSIALISGATSVRTSTYPDLLISLSERELAEHWHPVTPTPTLEFGARVRVCGGSYEGAFGEINHLFSHQLLFPSGVRARAARLRLEDGSLLVIPLTLLERVS